MTRTLQLLCVCAALVLPPASARAQQPRYPIRPSPVQGPVQGPKLKQQLGIASVRPSSGTEGDAIVITLNRAPASIPGLTVSFDGVATRLAPLRGNALRALVPPVARNSPGAICLLVSDQAGESDSFCEFTYRPRPTPLTISRVVPMQVAGGDSVVVFLSGSLPTEAAASPSAGTGTGAATSARARQAATAAPATARPAALTNATLAEQAVVTLDSVRSMVTNATVGEGQSVLTVLLPAGLGARAGACLRVRVRQVATPPFCGLTVVERQVASRPNWLVWTGVGIGLLLLSQIAIYLTLRNRRRQRARLEQTEMQLDQARFTIANIQQGSAPAAPASPAGLQLRAVPPQELVRAVAAGRCVLFAGGGISAQAGVPTWMEGLNSMVARVYGDREAAARTVSLARSTDVLAELIASRVKGEDLSALVRDVYRRPSQPLPPFFRALADIPFASVVTPNWDDVLESAFAVREPHVASPRDTSSLLASLSGARFTVLKVWGDPRRRDTLIFTPEEFRRATYDDPTFAKYLVSLYGDQTFLFAGATPAGITDFLSAVQIVNTGRVHYALVPWSEDIEIHREVMRSKYGIELLVFSASPGYPEVPAFFAELNALVRASAPMAEAPRLALEAPVLTRVVLRNIGVFEELTLDLRDGWNVLLGNNGFGKSTILRAIALGLCGEDPSVRDLPLVAGLLRTGRDEGSIELQVGDLAFQTRLKRQDGRVLVSSPQLTPLQRGRWVVLGFPPLRGVSQRRVEGASELGTSAKPMVDDLLPLLRGSVDSRVDNLNQWIVNTYVRSEGGGGVKPEEAKRYAALLDTFFKLMDRITPGERLRFQGVDKATWQVVVETESGRVPLSQVSQGMSSMISWVGVVLLRLYEIHGASPRPEQQHAFVMVDEIDAHMHPEWQRTVVEFVRDFFPHLQVLACTHSPLVVGALQPGETLQVGRDANTGRVSVARSDTQFQGLRADQILTSVFDLTTSMDKGTEALFQEYSRLLGEKNLSSEQLARRKDLEGKLGRRIPYHHETEEARKVAELWDQFLDERLNKETPERRDRIMKESDAFLAEMLAEIPGAQHTDEVAP